ncbi:MAG: maltose alpha-D-glucosyltransferase [Chloroflexaceae bacterium]|nr:maltose alpha-D-glucosyltransferase [Chloroflexaceae bacterium]NJL32714.1 maltose alpha-D-glucosyltransferase [Chloroflexaceae bacterium]NJO05294.1 maltose alpha-D-glucosyltransferase [Chloroflexaceae bacterium]
MTIPEKREQPNVLTITSDGTDWYKDAIIYELHVRAFADSDGDGAGDFRGLTSKLDYLRDLGITAIWLLPFSPSPLRDDGYDTADYTNVHPNYGTLQDFKLFLREAHARGLKVITELVLNHTSDQHPWFQRARNSPPGSKWRDFYVWSDTPDKYRDARIIFTDTENSNWAWDPVAKAYYWHRFFSHQPDLNYENPAVRKAMFQVIDFWFKLGVDGLRLDAVPYLIEREGTSCENLPETHRILKELRTYIDGRYQNRMLLAEANQWPEDAVAYFGNGDECHMAFHFPVMPRLFMSLRMEDRYPIIDIMRQTPEIPDNCQWAIFLRNHDELTLEMVTDEDRDYMYRIYAQDPQARINVGIRRRLAPLLGNHRRRIELLNGLLFSLPGSPVIYYGDEIGMGDNIYLSDRNAVRTPMQWSSDRNAGFSRANPQKLYLPVIIDPEYHYESLNVEAQQNNTHSLLWWTKRLISLRKRYKAFGRGTLEFLHPENRKVLVFLRRYEDENILIVANLSRFAQCVELDLSAYKNMTPVEMFGRTFFPPIGDLPYFLTLGPHAFYWFALEPAPTERDPSVPYTENLPVIKVGDTWESVLQGAHRGALEDVLPAYLKVRRWFGGKARTIQRVEIIETIAMEQNAIGSFLVLLRVNYTEGDPQLYALPVTYAAGEDATRVWSDLPQVVIALVQLKGQAEPGVLYDAVYDRDFSLLPLDAIARQRIFKGEHGEIIATATRAFRELLGNHTASALDPSLMRGEQSNTSIIYSDRFMLKLFRRLEEGLNPDIEIGRYLTDQQQFANTPALAGTLEYRRDKREPVAVAMLQAFVHNEGDAWNYTLDNVERFFEGVLTQHVDEVPPATSATSPFELLDADVPDDIWTLIGPYLESARLLGRRTAEMHLALANETSHPDFVPEPFNAQTQRSVYQNMRTQLGRVLPMLQRALGRMPDEIHNEAQQVLLAEERLYDRLQQIIQQKLTISRIRCHGDYHLGQVLYTGNDFLIIDFEGEPARSLAERRRKRAAIMDVAGMLRSFHYAAHTVLFNEVRNGMIRAETMKAFASWARLWYTWVSAAFLAAYLKTAEGSIFVPTDRSELRMLLAAYMLDKAVYEVGYELNNRPDWVRIPIWAVLDLLEHEA